MREKIVNETTLGFLTFLIRARWTTKLNLHFSKGRFYLRVFTLEDDKPKPFCFVDQLTGDVLGPQNINGPDRYGPRGNVLAEDAGQSAIVPEGLKKLKCGKPLGFKHEEVIPRPNARKPRGPYKHPTLIRVPKTVKPKVYGTLPVRVWTPPALG